MLINTIITLNKKYRHNPKVTRISKTNNSLLEYLVMTITPSIKKANEQIRNDTYKSITLMKQVLLVQ